MLFLNFRNKFSQISNAVNWYYGPRELINSYLMHKNYCCELEQKQESELKRFLPFAHGDSLQQASHSECPSITGTPPGTLWE